MIIDLSKYDFRLLEVQVDSLITIPIQFPNGRYNRCELFYLLDPLPEFGSSLPLEHTFDRLQGVNDFQFVFCDFVP
jgi:hypothetical protein